MRKSVVAGAVAIGVSAALVGFAAARSKQQDSVAPAESAPEELEELRAQVDRLERGLRVQRSAVRATQAAQAASAAANPSTDDDEASTQERPKKGAVVEPKQELSVEQELRMYAEELHRLDARFATESQNSAWSREALPLAASEVKNYLPSDSRIASLECRESACRAETVHANVDRYREFLNAPRTKRQWDVASITRIVGEGGPGPVTSVMYFARPGVNLAELVLAEEEVE